MSRASAIVALLVVTTWSARADAVRWTLGVATELTPVVVDPGRPDGLGAPFRLGVRPVVDLEINRYLAFGAYAPFVVLRAGEGGGAASTGAESVFGLAAYGRYPVLYREAPEELLLYGTARGGFGTIAGRAGPFVGLALGASLTWLDTGRGVFMELGGGHVAVNDAAVEGGQRDVTRTTLTFSVGVVFRLGGESWLVTRHKL